MSSTQTVPLELHRSHHPSDGGSSEAVGAGPIRYFSEFERLKTFPKSWPGQFTKDDLAKNGFYCYEGFCVCAFCNIKLVLASTGRALCDVHKIISENCTFAKGTDNRNVPLGEADNYRLEKHRLASFLRTNWTFPVDPYDLAKWGFYWTGSADVGRCAFCRLEVRGWEEGDQGRSEHERWNPQCAFIQGREVGNVPLGQETEEHNLVNDCAVFRRNGSLGPIHRLGNRPPQTAAELGVVRLDPPKHAEYVNMQARLDSFSAWPLSIAQRPKELAEAGFYYTGKGDRVVCFQCGGGLKDWGPTDDPWVEHAVWFFQCSYLVMKKGPDFIKKVQDLKNAQPNGVTPDININNGSVTEKVETSVKMAQENVKTELTEHNTNAETKPNEGVTPLEINNNERNNRDLFLCKICFQKELSIVFLPCGHVASCSDCASQLLNCPICRKQTSAYVRMYLA